MVGSSVSLISQESRKEGWIDSFENFLPNHCVDSIKIKPLIKSRFSQKSRCKRLTTINQKIQKP